MENKNKRRTKNTNIKIKGVRNEGNKKRNKHVSVLTANMSSSTLAKEHLT